MTLRLVSVLKKAILVFYADHLAYILDCLVCYVTMVVSKMV